MSDWDELSPLEIDNHRLRADLAAVTSERDRLREALKPLIEIEDYPDTILMKRIDRARAALEGVTEPASPWRDIESAPKDGTYIDLWISNGERIPDARWNDRQRRWEVWSLGDYDGMEFVAIAGDPTHWMPLPEPPR